MINNTEKNPSQILQQKIMLVEMQREKDFEILHEQFKTSFANLSPLNIIKNTLKDVVNSKEIKNDVADAGIGFTTGYLAKKILFGSTINPIKIVAGSLLQTLVSNISIKNADTIKAVASKIFGAIRTNKNKKHEPYK